MPAFRLSIVGLGLIGGSLALVGRQRLSGCHITGYDREGSDKFNARWPGQLDLASASIEAAVADADLIVLATPVGQLGETLRTIAPHLKPLAVVTDVGSTKRSIVEIASDCLPDRFVGSHPMAGGEKNGVAAARADLFEDALCLLTPTSRTDPVALKTAEWFWSQLGSRTQQISALDHDRLIASASHLPHAVAALLIASIPNDALPLGGKGLADTTRIAAAHAGLWRDIFLDNHDNVRASIASFRCELDRFESLLDPTRSAELEKYLADIADRRRSLR